MKRAGKIILPLALLALLGWFFSSTRSTTPAAARQKRLVVIAETTISSVAVSTNGNVGSPNLPPANNKPILGETILRGYGTPASTPENDLTLMAHLMDNFSLLVKSATTRPMSVNEDWAAAFRGLNPAHERFLPDQHVALNAQGQLVDRWQTPLFFHPLGNQRFEIRSAGPDKKMWTADDLHRNADGSFRHGATLNPLSLLDDATRAAAR